MKVSALIFEKYPLISKILQDKYDFIFIDEYQDSNKDIIDIFLNKIPKNSKTIIGLFGDSMQGIYDDGVGDVEKYILNNSLKKIEKEDNFRSSKQVKDFINQFRNDGLKQKIALKLRNGVMETQDDREGKVKLYYLIYDTSKPHVRSSPEDKQKYLDTLKKMISKVEKKHIGFKKLMLTNKSIAYEVGFENLYDVFNARYFDVREEIEKDLIRLQLIDLVELCEAYETKNYNFILTRIKKSGFELKKIKDKIIVSEILNNVTKSTNKGAIEVLEMAFDRKILKKSESYLSFINRKKIFFDNLKKDSFYAKFKTEFENGLKTFFKMQKKITDLEEEQFNEYEKLLKKENFYKDLFSNRIKFVEIIKYYSYLNENTEFITMHKTKGSGIQNIIVVLEEYFWSKFNFKIIFDTNETNMEKKLYNQKLFYVACSRAIENLICVRIISKEEEKDLIKYFPCNERLIIKKQTIANKQQAQ